MGLLSLPRGCDSCLVLLNAVANLILTVPRKFTYTLLLANALTLNSYHTLFHVETRSSIQLGSHCVPVFL
jgi:hypothetical protein